MLPKTAKLAFEWSGQLISNKWFSNQDPFHFNNKVSWKLLKYFVKMQMNIKSRVPKNYQSLKMCMFATQPTKQEDFYWW